MSVAIHEPAVPISRMRVVSLGLFCGVTLAVAVLAAPALGGDTWRAQSPNDTPLTLVPGAGLGHWRIGMNRQREQGLLRVVQYPKNMNQQGCVSFVPHISAAVIDYYRGIRLAWISLGGGKYSLNGIATSRTGDHSIEGFTVGRATFQAVKRRYGKGRRSTASDLKAWGADRLGAFFWSVEISTGYESADTLTFWFTVSGRLRAIETAGSGC